MKPETETVQFCSSEESLEPSIVRAQDGIRRNTVSEATHSATSQSPVRSGLPTLSGVRGKTRLPWPTPDHTRSTGAKPKNFF